MIIIWIIIGVIFVSFGLIVLLGAPYVPTKNKDLEQIFATLKLPPNAKVVDLGSGDGRVLIAAANKGYRAQGYELNPILWLISLLRTWRCGKLVHVSMRDLWTAKLADANVVFIFTAAPYVKRLEKKFKSELSAGAMVVSYGFQLPSKKPHKQIGSAWVYRF